MSDHYPIGQPNYALVVTRSDAISYFAGGHIAIAGDSFPLSTKRPNIIGRSDPSVTIFLRHGLVARKHCQIVWDATTGTFLLSHLNGVVPPTLNGKLFDAASSVSLNVGDEIQCGPFLLCVQRAKADDY